MSYIDVFGGSTVQPSDVGFRAVALSASIITVWPPFATSGNQVARIMKVSASAGSLTITLPDATLTSLGQDILFDNAGANTFTVLDSAGNSIATLTAGQIKYLYLSDNSTSAGTWRVTLFGASSSTLDASQLKGYGLKALSNTLNFAPAVSQISGDTTVTLTDRAKVFVWNGGSGTVTLPTTSASTSDFNIEVRNQGSGMLTVAPVGGALIDGSGNIALSVNEACFVHMGTSDWYTVGLGKNSAFNFTQLVRAVTGGTLALSLTEASNVVQTYNGTLVSNQTVNLPAIVQVYYVSNDTSGAYTLTFGCVGGGTSVSVNAAQAAILFCDGTNVINADTQIAGGPLTLLLNAGTAAAPSLGVGSTATGFYSSGTDEIGITINGTYLGKFAVGGLTLDGLTASSALATDASKTLISVTNTGSGKNVLDTSPTLVTPTLGVATATCINKITLTAPATGSTITVADGKTLTASNTLTLSATDGSTLAIGTGGTLGTSAYTATATPTTLGLVIGTDVQAYDPDLTTWAAITPGTGIATVLAINTGTDGAPVIKGGALGTPSSGNGSNITNVNAATLGGATFAAPGSIAGVTIDTATNKPVTAASLAGGTLPASVTTLSASGAITGGTGTFAEVAITKIAAAGEARALVTNVDTGASSRAGYQVQTAISPNIWHFFARNGSGWIGQDGVIDSVSFDATTGKTNVLADLAVTGALSASENISTSLNKTGLLEISTSNPNSGTNSGAAFNSYYGAIKMSGIGHYWDGGAFQNLLEYYQTLNIKKTDGTAVAVLDSHGNLGLGVVPSAWTMRAIELVGGALASNGADNIHILANSYFNGANYIYKAPGLASRYQQDAMGHAWYTSPPGTAGTAITFTQAMKLDANGNLSNVGVIKTGVFTAGTLPSASAVGVGSRVFVTDANTTVILGLGLTVIGGGSNKVPVYSDGTNWIVG